MNPFFLTGALLAAASASSDPLPAVGIDSDRITVSGISAGGAMANQLHIAYADVFSGAGIIAGVPFGCSDGSLRTAMSRCMGKTDDTLSIPELAAAIRAASDDGRIADTSLLSNDPVWLFHGTLDTVVAGPVSDELHALYLEFIPIEQVVYVDDTVAAHTFPTRGHGTDCSASVSPFVGNCDYDAAGELLKHLYPGLNTPSTEIKTELTSVSLPGAVEAGLSETAYLFIPPVCSNGQEACALHLVLHGCAQSAAQVGTTFIEQSGYLPWAEANNIVLAFPQVVSGPTNPYACWDWWAYTGENYRWRDGAQMKVLTDWVGSLSSGD